VYASADEGDSWIPLLRDLPADDEPVGKVALDRILEHFQSEEDSEDLRLFIIIEEVHLWTAK
jgi:hypothetical protein